MIIHRNEPYGHIRKISEGRIKFSSYVLALYIAFLPISTSLAGLIGSSSLQNYVALIYVIISFFELVNTRKLMVKQVLLPIYAYFFYTIASSLWNDNLSIDWYFIQFFISTLLVFFITNKNYSQREYSLFKQAIYTSAIIVGLVTILNLSTAYSYRLTIRVSSEMDPNDFACGLSVIIAMCLTETLQGKRKGLNYAIVLIMIVIIFLTGSRGAMIMALSMILVWILKTNGRKRIKVIMATIIGGILVYLFAFDNTTSYLLSRYTITNILRGGGSGRYKIWSSALKTFKDSNILRMIFGYGHGGFRDAVNYIAFGHQNAYEAHNIFINEIIEGGIIGLILIIRCFMRTLTVSRDNIFGILLVVGFIVEGLTLDAQVYRVFAVVISFAVIWRSSRDLEYIEAFV